MTTAIETGSASVLPPRHPDAYLREYEEECFVGDEPRLHFFIDWAEDFPEECAAA